MKKVLKASAGTGKTYRLSLEYLAALFFGQDYTEIAVLTFTRKATAEARERIFDHIQNLEKKGQESEVWQNLISLYPDLTYRPQLIHSCRRQMLQNKERIQIYTIDSFINRIFREVVAPYLGIYDYEITEGEENEEAHKEIFRRMLAREEYFSLLENIFQFRVDRNFEEILSYIQSLLDERWKYLLVENEKVDRSRGQGINFVEALDGCLQILQEAAASKGEDLNKDWFISNYTSPLQGYLRLKRQDQEKEILQQYILKYRNIFLKEKKTFWNGKKVMGKKNQHVREQLQSQYQLFQERLAHYVLEKELVPLEKELFHLAEVVYQEYDKLKLKQKSFTHSDISNYVYKYVARGELELPGGNLNNFLTQITGGEIKSLFIDEFQDTSVLQWKVLEKLLTEERDFIAVGDAKQSIYQWRGGEKELFIRLPRLIGGEEETLPVCYRSDRKILDFVNDMFLNLDHSWDYEEVKPHPQAGTGYVKVLLGGSRAEINEETKKFSRWGEEKQEAVREQNNNLVQDMPRYIAREIKNRFDNYEGVAVLARKNSDLNDIEDQLSAMNVPFIRHQEGKLLENKAVWPLYQLLLFLWRGEYHCLLNFLRSDLVGITHSSLKFLLRNREDIEEIIDWEQDQNLTLEKQELLEKNSKMVPILDWIRDIYQKEYEKMAYELINESGVISLVDGDRGLLKNIFRFYSLLRQQDSLADFMEFCQEEQESPQLQEVSVQGENAVDLLTVHKAKGLSFDTVFFYWKPSSLRAGNSRNSGLNFSLRFDSNYQDIEEYLLFPSRYSKIMPWVDYSFQEEKETDSLNEEINNVYVAMTRAVHNLFLMIETPVQIEPGELEAWEDKDDYGFYEPGLLQAAAENSLTDLIKGKEFGKLVSPEAGTEVEVKDTEKAASFFRRGQKHVSSAEKEKINVREDLDLETDRGRLQGLALHYYLENITTGTAREKKLARKLVTSNYGNILGPELIEKAVTRAEKIIEDNPEIFAEKWQVFTEYIPGSISPEEEEARIDRLLVDKVEKKIIIIDYKSGGSRKQSQLDRYRDLIRKEVGEEYEIETEFVAI